MPRQSSGNRKAGNHRICGSRFREVARSTRRTLARRHPLRHLKRMLQSTPLSALVARAAAPGPRIEPVDLEGARYWIKRPEALSLRWRLQKGDPLRLFAAERETHRLMQARGVPVPPLLAEAEDYLILPDCGPTLAALMRAADRPSHWAAFAAAGTALARLHALGLAHGRPQPRDLCWDGATLRFLDFERGGVATRRQQAFDLIQLVYGIHCHDLEAPPEAQAVLAAYRAEDQSALWPVVARWAKRLRWLEPLTRPAQWYEARYRGHKRFHEVRALPAALALLSA